MILTDRFVVLNFPRTGSTFVRAALRHVYGRRLDALTLRDRFPWSPPRFHELLLPIDRTWKARRLRRHSQHGRWGQIPESHRHLPVVSVVRHPLDHAVSSYMHEDWWTSPPADEDDLRRRFPGWPRLSFTEYLDFEREFALPDVLQGIQPAAEIGCLTAHFLRFYARNPEQALVRLTDERLTSGDVRVELPPVHWLRHSHLVEDLVAFLREVGLPPRAIDAVRRHPRVNVSHERRDLPWRAFYTPVSESLKRQRERFLFRLFPCFDE
jgi:hypothetical protein